MDQPRPAAIRRYVQSATLTLLLGAIAPVLVLSGCSSAYYNTMEKFGVHKRDIMVDRVKEARDAQTEPSTTSSTASTSAARARLIRYTSVLMRWSRFQKRSSGSGGPS